jgi:hypothetical protein
MFFMILGQAERLNSEHEIGEAMFGSILLSVKGREAVRVPRQKPAVSMTGEYQEENERDGRAQKLPTQICAG